MFPATRHLTGKIGKSDTGLVAARGRPYRGSQPKSSSFRITFAALSSTVSRSVDTTTSGLRGSSTVHVELDETPHHLPHFVADFSVGRDRPYRAARNAAGLIRPNELWGDTCHHRARNSEPTTVWSARTRAVANRLKKTAANTGMNANQ
jgi:hypothetical protein